MADINALLRKNIRTLTPYSSARDEYEGEEAVFLDANENPYNQPYNRYPDPHQKKLKDKIAGLKSVRPEQIFLGNGSDEAIDLLIRAFCEPKQDNIVSIKPTYGMYKVCADINDVEYREVELTEDFQLNTGAILDLADERSKLLFLCSPNNPTSNSFRREDLLHLVHSFRGLTVLDEAYVDFSGGSSLLPELDILKSLVVLQTFSKAWGMAGARLGLAFADREVIAVLDRIKYPYNVNALTQKMAMDQIESAEKKNKWVSSILSQRKTLQRELEALKCVKHILPSDANFLMVCFDRPAEVFRYLIDRKIVVRDRSSVALCEGFLRVTIGTENENSLLVQALKQYELQIPKK
jgi:histidinol-phosphate aminotransferase